MFIMTVCVITALANNARNWVTLRDQSCLTPGDPDPPFGAADWA
jgi:hypothetical protein